MSKNYRSRFAFAALIATSLLANNAESQTVSVPGGTFQMGSENGEADEKPVRTVRISPFQMHTTEVTVGQYSKCVAEGRCTPAHYDDGKCLQWNGNRFARVVVPQKYRSPEYPVICVTWQQARTYCSSVGMKLPSEAQWEYAAKAGGNSTYSWGSNPEPFQCPQSMKGDLRPVKSCKGNGWGIHDMSGNVWEWTADYYEKNSYEFIAEQDPTGPAAGLYRTVRGGSWYSGQSAKRVTKRHWFSPNFAETSVGFRCVK